MVAITGPRLRRRHEVLALWATALATLLVVVVPTLFVVLLPAAATTAALAAPAGRRLPAALVTWAPLSLAVVLGGIS